MIWGARRHGAGETVTATPIAGCASGQTDLAANVKAYRERTAELEAELAAMPEPPDPYRISKDFQSGTFTVRKWVKRIANEHFVWALGQDDRQIVAGWSVLKEGMPSHEAAEGWLAAYIDPTTNETGYDAQGKRLRAHG